MSAYYLDYLSFKETFYTKKKIHIEHTKKGEVVSYIPYTITLSKNIDF